MKQNKILQLTLAIIKPHAIKQPHALEAIRDTIVANNFLIVRSQRKLLSKDHAEKFYEEHKEKFFYNRLITFMSSGPSDFYILARDNAILGWRKLMGPTKVYQAQFTAPDSIRGSFGLSDTRNAAHGSDSPEAAYREIELFFPDFDPEYWLRNQEKQYREGQLKFLKKEFVHVPIEH